MQTHFSARELLAFAAPGLPTSLRRLQIRATTEGWPNRKRSGSAREVEYPIDALPAATQAFIRGKQRAAIGAAFIGAQATPEPQERGVDLAAVVAEATAARTKADEAARLATIERRAAARATIPTKTCRAQSKGYARSEILGACEAWFKTQRDEAARTGMRPLPQGQGEHIFCAEYNAGRIDVHPATREQVPSVHKATLDRWRKKRTEEGMAGLMDQHKGRSDTGKIDQCKLLQAIIVRQAINNLHVRSPLIRDEMRSQVKAGGLLEHLWRPGMLIDEVDRIIPSESAILRWLRKFNEADGNLLDAIKDPDGHRGRAKSAFGDADQNILAFCQLWELDSTKGDIILADGKRYVVVGCIDIWSRNAKLLVVPTAKAVGIAAMFRKCLLDPTWGVPSTIRIDNGSDYISRHMMDIYEDLNIEPWVCPPGQPQKKPFIERFFGTFARSLVEFLPGFIGHSVAERKSIESRQAAEGRANRKRMEACEEAARKLVHVGGDIEVRMNPDEFQKFCDRWLTMYHHKQHGSLDGLTPFQKRAAWAGELARVPERALDMLLMEGDRRTVGKDGITFERHTYGAEALDARWRGKLVRIKYDAADAGVLYVYHPEAEGGFLCKAICPELVGVPRAELAAQMMAADGKYYSDGKRRLKTLAKQAGDESSYERILGMYEDRASSLRLFPRPEVEHSTPMLDAAAIAMAQEPVREAPAALTEAEVAAAEALYARPVHNDELFDWERAIFLEEKVEAAGELPATETAELERLRRHPGYAYVLSFMNGAPAESRAM